MTTETEIALNPEVVAHLDNAVTASSSLTREIRAAAIIASEELDFTLEAPKAVDEVIARYAEIYAESHNVKALFSDALYLAYCGNQPITYTPRSYRGEEKAEIHTSASEALVDDSVSHNNFRKIASAAKADNGHGRKSGGGRKSGTPSTPKSGPVASPLADAEKAIDALLASPDSGEKALREILKARGFQLRKSAK